MNLWCNSGLLARRGDGQHNRLFQLLMKDMSIVRELRLDSPMKTGLTDTADYKRDHKPGPGPQQLVEMIYSAKSKQSNKNTCCRAGRSIVVESPGHDARKDQEMIVDGTTLTLV